jgi:Sigma-70, region 4.
LCAEKLHDGDFRFVEKLLYEQKTHETAIAQLEAELAELLERLMPGGAGSVIDLSMPKSRREHSQTELWAIRREENLRVRYLRQRIEERKRHKEAVDRALECLDEREMQYVQMRYWQERSHSHIARAMHMWDRSEHAPKRNYWKLRRQVLTKVARYVL